MIRLVFLFLHWRHIRLREEVLIVLLQHSLLLYREVALSVALGIIEGLGVAQALELGAADACDGGRASLFFGDRLHLLVLRENDIAFGALLMGLVFELLEVVL